MKKLMIFTIILLFLPYLMQSNALNDSWIKIDEPKPGIYIHGEKIMNSRYYIFIQTNSIKVVAIASSNILMTYLVIYNVMKKELVYGIWDMDSSDGFSCNFNLHTGIYAIAAVGAALDINEPVAFDWIMPVVVINV